MEIDKLIIDLEKALVALLGKKYSDLKPEIQKDIDDFLEKSKKKMKRWTLLLAETSITIEEFEWLLKSQKDILVLKALQSAGVSKVRLNTIKNSIIKTTFDIVLAALIKQ
ncbi:hypothetical protein [Flavobacterium sp.]|uniref:hypothetical protein n=1 Tax=Flavobacterium sp. TaxID=239 RepID=UPI0040484BD7